MRLALAILNRGSTVIESTDPNISAALNMTALSLTGFRLDKAGGALWRDLVRKNSAQITDPYLRYFRENFDT